MSPAFIRPEGVADVLDGENDDAEELVSTHGLSTMVWLRQVEVELQNNRWALRDAALEA